MSAICPGSDSPRRNSATAGTPRASTMLSIVARYSRASVSARSDAGSSATGSSWTQVASPVPATPTPIDARPSPRITKASVPPRIRPRSSIFAMVPTRAYRPSSRGTSTSRRSSSEAAASTAARASGDSRVSVTTIPGRTTPVVSGRRGRVSVSRSDIGMIPFPSKVCTCENAAERLRIPGKKHDYAVTRLRPSFTFCSLAPPSVSAVVVGWTPYGVPMAGAIVAEGLRKNFGTVEALRGIDLDVASGTVFGFLGPNGAGKTTAVRIFTTLLLPDGGRAEVVGLDVVRDAEALRARIGLAGQSAAVDENLTGLENIQMVGRLYHLSATEARRRAGEILERFGLAEAADRQAKTYSGGMRRRLDVAASLVARPDVLFLDEPTTGLDPRSRIDLWAMIRELVQEGKTILLTTQYLEEADNLADRIAVVDLGTIIAEGTADELKDQIGGEVLELHVKDPAQAGQVAQALSGVGVGEPSIDQEAGKIRIPDGSDGPAALLDSVRRIDDMKLALEDIALHRPTLDDVFLSLTGHAAEEEQQEQASSGRRKRGRRRGQRSDA